MIFDRWRWSWILLRWVVRRSGRGLLKSWLDGKRGPPSDLYMYVHTYPRGNSPICASADMTEYGTDDYCGTRIFSSSTITLSSCSVLSTGRPKSRGLASVA